MRYQPDKVNLQSLYQLLIEFEDFPKSSHELERLARDHGADHSVISFFEAIPGRVFEQRADVFYVAETIDNFWHDAGQPDRPSINL